MVRKFGNSAGGSQAQTGDGGIAELFSGQRNRLPRNLLQERRLQVFNST
jgi:hypothetical protein